MAGGRRGEHASRVAIRSELRCRRGSFPDNPTRAATCAIDLCPFPFPTFALFGCFLRHVVAKICTVPLPFFHAPAFPPDGLQFAISHPIPRMSILVSSLKRPAGLPTGSPSPSTRARHPKVKLPQGGARMALLPFAGRGRRAAAARARGGLRSRNLVTHPPQPAVFASLHFPAAVEGQAGRNYTPPQSRREREQRHSAAAG